MFSRLSGIGKTMISEHLGIARCGGLFTSVIAFMLFAGMAASASGYVVIHSHTGGASDGSNPYASLILDGAGNLYGTTYNGGSADMGTEFTLPSLCLAPPQPAPFTAASATVCQGQNDVVYTVPNDPTFTYNWSYSGTGATISGSGDSVTVSFSTTATSGTLSVTATNVCGTSPARSLAITIGPPLSVATSGSGTGVITSSPIGIDCGSTCIMCFSVDTIVTLTANPSLDSAFMGWTGDCTGVDTCVLTMDAAKSVAANFARAIPADERNALIAIFNSTNGANWNNHTNWLGAIGTECTWYGVTCDTGEEHVTRLMLGSNHLAGPIPEELADLIHVNDLDFSHNQLSGDIPDLSSLMGLQYLNLCYNWSPAAGAIPDWLGSMTQLIYLNLLDTNRSGPIPASFGNLINLRYLSLDSNQLTGEIPDLHALTNLHNFDLGNNPSLTPGPIPSWLQSMSQLGDLDLHETNRNGPIPAWFDSLVNLQIIYLNSNQLSGNLPDLNTLTDFWVFNISNNPTLTAEPIPDWLQNMTELRYLMLSETNRTGSIPTWLGNLTNLHTIYLNDNQFSGEIPDLHTLTNLLNLDLSNNLTLTAAPIPEWLQSLPKVYSIVLSRTNRTGAIPTWLGGLTSVRNLYLDSNQLSGGLPLELGNLTRLDYLHLQGNQLSGIIPTELQNLTSLVSTGLGLGWNALYSTDSALTTFLNSKQNGGDWQSTQTIAPASVTHGIPQATAIPMNWTPITYTADGGGYQVFYSTTAGGPYTLFGTTASKTASTLTVTGLNPATPYYFVVQTVTNPHANNANTVTSEPSDEILTSTLEARTLTVNTNGTGSGTVTSNPPGINCGSTCEAPFALNSTVSLIASAASGSVFSNWSGACSGTGVCSVTMDDNKSVTAEFTLDPTANMLTVSPSGSGTGTVTSSPMGIDCGIACQASYPSGVPVTLTATAQIGSYFVGWSGDCAGSETTCQVGMDQSRYVVANFYSGPIIPQSERDALIAFHTSTNGANWNIKYNWLGPVATECTWYGVTCNVEGSHVTRLVLRNNRLAGPLPINLTALSSLQNLDLYGNQLNGDIPDLSPLIALQRLDLGSNRTLVAGPIPDWLASMTSLAYLSLNNTNRTGEFPDLGALTNINELNLSSNSLLTASPIPDWLGNLTQLVNLNLSNTNRNGPVPASLGNLTNLRYLSFRSNQLSGSIPDLHTLSNLEALDLGSNQSLTAEPIPHWLQSMTALRTLGLAQTNRNGTIPAWLDSLTNLQYLNLSNNQFTGEIPDLHTLLNLQQLNLSNNPTLTPGPIPSWLQTMTTLRYLYLSQTNRNGTIPAWMGNLTNLRTIYLNDNQFSGDIPDLHTIANLGSLDLSRNGMLTAGPIPEWLQNLPGLSTIGLSGTHRTGNIPTWLGSITNLTNVYLADNHLSGGLPAELGALSALRYLQLQGNLLTGSIPTQFFGLINLYNTYGLDLRWNALYSTDPALTTFLNSKQTGGNWQNTQTIAPTAVNSGATQATSIPVNWTPVTYTADGGGYQVCYSTTTGGPYTLFGTTASKAVANLTVTGLSPTTTYYLVVRTVTNPHVNNSNIVMSNTSSEITATTADVRALVVNRSGSGSGMVISNPSGINCGTTCSALFTLDDQVRLTASAAAGSVFSGWTGACSGTDVCILTMSSDRSVNATFTTNPNSRTLTVSTNGTGNGSVTSSPMGIDCGLACAASYALGVPVTLVATAASDSTFWEWGGDCAYRGEQPSCDFIMNQARNVTAAFQFGIVIPKSERDALVTLYNSTNGANWYTKTNWLGAIGTECTWYGVTCNTEQTHVTSLALPWNRLAGPIPTELVALTHLTKLDLGGNQLNGDIPDLSAFISMQHLNLYYNNSLSTGPIPSWLAGMNALTYLDLSSTNRNGAIPDLHALTNLTDFNIAYNWSLTAGPIPDWLGGLTHLTSLNLAGTQRNGPIPTWLGNLTNLRYLYLSSNQLSGSIPDLHTLSNLEGLDLGSNQSLTAEPIPHWLQSMTTLRSLYLSATNRNGTIPAWLGNLTNLQNLSLSNNQFTGEIPDLHTLLNLQQLNLSNNPTLTPGQIPAWLQSMTTLRYLYLSQTNRNGTIPAWLDSLTNLQNLSLGNNQFTGEIPDLHTLTNLQQLYLSGNPTLTPGQIPAWLQSMTTLRYLYLSQTNRNGTIPAWMGNLTNLYDLYLNDNHLSGGLPAELGALNMLRYLLLQGNQLTGSIPSQFLLLTNLYNTYGLDLRWNALFSTDPALTAFLNSKQTGGNWQNTQTIAPSAVTLSTPQPTSIQVNWSPITYTSDSGGYQVLYSTSAGGPYTPFGTTASKTASTLKVTGLNPTTLYYFVVQSMTNPHANNANTVTSGPSGEIFASTLEARTLTVNTSGTGSGTVTSNPSGINCGSTCEGLFGLNSTLSLIASATSGSVFSNWSGACSGTGVCSVTMDDNKSVTAEFTSDPTANMLTVSTSGSGTGTVTSSPMGIDCGIACQASYPSGVPVTLTATAFSGSSFWGWNGDCAGSHQTCQVAMTQARNVTATFVAGAVIPQGERNALIALYNSTDGANWYTKTNWLGAIGTECTWYGVTCNADATHLTELDLIGNYLQGTVPSDLANLTEMQKLDLGSNRLTGLLPDLHAMTKLRYFNLYWNPGFTAGPIPSWIEHLTELTYLGIGGTQRNGAIPDWIGNLTKLRNLYLNSNQLTGTIPIVLAKLHDMRMLSLYSNQFSGEIPDLHTMTGLTYLNVSHNNLLTAGPIPAWLEGMSQLTTLSLSSTNRNGVIPAWLGDLTNLQDLDLSYNSSITAGPIPDSMQNLTQLRSLDLSGTNRNGMIPAWLGNLTNLQNLLLNDNQFTDEIPDLHTLTNLQQLNLSNNPTLTPGQIPAWLQTMTTLRYLYLSQINRNGTIPAWMGNLTNLYSLNLNGNHLSGGLPAELGALNMLRFLLLQGNQLTGSIPTQFMGLTNLYSYGLDLRWNALFSTDPALITFLNSKQTGGNWQNTQTIAPSSAAIGTQQPTSIQVNWSPIAYTVDSGGYQVLYSTTTGGPYTLFGTTANKTATNLTVTGLNPSTPYYFVIQTVTNPHANNPNTVTSELSVEVSATTPEGRTLTVNRDGLGTGTVTSNPFGINCGANCSTLFTIDSSVTLTASATSGFVFYGWSGACTGLGPCQLIMNTDKAVTASFGYDITPKGLQAVAASGPAVDTSWIDTSDYETQFVIERRTAGEVNFQVLVTLPANTISFHDTNALVAGKTYYYRVRGEAGAVTSAWSNIASATIPMPNGTLCKTNIMANRKYALNQSLEYGNGYYGALWREVLGDSSALVYARLDLTGQIIEGPMTVTPWANHSVGGRIVWSGSQWGMLWYEKLVGSEWGLFFKTIDTHGLPTSSTIRIDNGQLPRLYYHYRNLGLAKDSAGWGVVWSTANIASIQYAHIANTGVIDVPATTISTEVAGSGEPVIAYNGTDYGVAWYDRSVSPTLIRFARISLSGVPASSSVIVTPDARPANFMDMAWNGSEFGVAWSDSRDGDGAVYFRRLDIDGNPLSPETRISDPKVGDTSFVFAADLVLRWLDDRWVVAADADFIVGTMEVVDILLTYADSTGAKLGPDVAISNPLDEHGGDFPSLAWGSGSLLCLWHEGLADFTWEINGQAMDASGNTGSNPRRILTTGHSPGAGARYGGVSVAATATGYALAWTEAGVNPTLSLVDRNGVATIPQILIPGAPTTSFSSDPLALAFSGEVIAVVWHGDVPTYGSLCFSRFGLDGAKQGTDVLLSSTTPIKPTIIWTGQAFLIAWSDRRDGNAEIYTAAIAADGTVLAAANRISNFTGTSTTPSLAGDGRARAVVWQDSRSEGTYHIYSASLDALGARIGPEIRVSDNAASQMYASVAWNGSEFLIAWADLRDSAYSHVYYRRLDANANPIGTDSILMDTVDTQPRCVWGGDRFGVVTSLGYYSEIDMNGVKIGTEKRLIEFGSSSRLAWDGQKIVMTYVTSYYIDSSAFLQSVNCAMDTTPPSCPIGLSVNSSSNNNVLNWTPVSDADYAVAWQIIYRDGIRFAVVEPGVSTWTDTLAASRVHTYQVTSFNQGNVESPGCGIVSTAGIIVSPTSGLTTTESGGQATFTVVLANQPDANVVISMSSSDTTEGTINPTNLTFTTSDWNTPKTVTITGVDDAIVDGDIAYTINTSSATSSDPNYQGIDPANVLVTNQDNDTVGAILTVTVTGSGSGSVASTPAGIDCGSECSVNFALNTVVTLTPTASSDSVFTGWSGACIGAYPCVITMNAVKSVTANFNLKGLPTGFYPVTPCRVFDTRDPSGAPIIAGGGHRTFPIVGKCGIPVDAKAITGNVTVVNGSVVGSMSIVAGNLNSTLTTTIEIPLARARANNATIQLATDGEGTIMVINNSSGTVHLILDVNGYFQ